MLDIVYTEEFAQNYQALPLSIQKKIEKQEKLFRANPFHPSLRTEKLAPKQHELWSLHVDLRYRIIFRFLETTTVVLLTVNTHDRVYRLRG